MSVAPRLGRLLAADGRCFDVAIDHGVFNEPTFLPGIEDMPAAVATIVAAQPDAVQLTPGQAPLLQEVRGPRKPALVLRVDVANIYGPNPPDELFCSLMDGGVESALRLDAACVVAFLLWIPGETDLHRQCVENLCRLKPECDRWGMPLMVEPIAMKPDGKGGLGVDGDPDRIATLVRQAVELGADVIKADPTDDLDHYGRVLRVASGKPVLVRGGGKASEEEIFARTERVIRAGAAGIVYGRNVIQHDKPSAVTRAFMAIVHDGASAADATRILRQG
ncbi:aldolase [Candidatus Binatia bacterium]|jgi:DhnA family fructose-bisphosphate aldolase class Ia|nr:aldolase [Candidatus Binatia bacterium]